MVFVCFRSCFDDPNSGENRSELIEHGLQKKPQQRLFDFIAAGATRVRDQRRCGDDAGKADEREGQHFFGDRFFHHIIGCSNVGRETAMTVYSLAADRERRASCKA